MNTTLTADEALIAKARAYAQARDTTLDQLVLDYLERIAALRERRFLAQSAATAQRIGLSNRRWNASSWKSPGWGMAEP